MTNANAAPEFGTQQLLEAMDGIVMLLDASLKVTHVGWPNWYAFWRANTDAGYAQNPLGMPVTNYFSSGTVRDTYHSLFTDILTGARGAVHVDYRCDAPDTRRFMRLSVTPVMDTDQKPTALLYQSTLLSEESRPPLALFDGHTTIDTNLPFVTLCSICARVAWPPNPEHAQQQWIEASVYYQQGGSDNVNISHGFCSSCYHRLLAADSHPGH